MNEHKSFIDLCYKLSQNPHYVQGAGGNVSYKLDDVMFVKASGTMMKDLRFDLLSPVFWEKIKEYQVSPLSKTDPEEVYLKKIRSFKKDFEHRLNPSMETGFHAVLDKYVLHSHPTAVSVFLCSVEGKEWFKANYSKDFIWVDYVAPGQNLTAKIIDSLNQDNGWEKSIKIIFLKNHGLIISANDLDTAIKAQEEVFKLCLEKLGFLSFNQLQNENSLSELPNKETKGFLFPDQVVFEDFVDKSNPAYRENINAALWIEDHILKLGWTPQYLSEKECNILRGMKSESERKKIAKA